MTKNEFNSIMKEKLSVLPNEDIEKSLEYYNEIIEDKTDDGISEEQAVSELGPMEKIVADILEDTSLTKLIKGSVKNKRTLKVWEIVFLILGSPVWLSLLLAVVCVIFCVYISLWAVCIALYASTLGIAAGALGGILLLVLFAVRGYAVSGVFMFGLGIISAGLAILLFFASNIVAKYVLILGKKILLGIKISFVGKGKQ